MFDQPFVRDSFIQQIDPRMRVLLSVLLEVALALLRQMTACCLGLGLGCVLLGLAQAPLGPLWRRLVAINMFILFLWLVTPWTTPGGRSLAVAFHPSQQGRGVSFPAGDTQVQCHSLCFSGPGG